MKLKKTPLLVETDGAHFVLLLLYFFNGGETFLPIVPVSMSQQPMWRTNRQSKGAN